MILLLDRDLISCINTTGDSRTLLHRHPLTRLSLVAEERRMLVFVAFVLGCHVRQLGFMPDIKSFFFLIYNGAVYEEF